MAEPAVAVVEELAACLTDQPENPLRPYQTAEHEEELDRLEAMAAAPVYVSGHNRGMAIQQVKKLRAHMDRHAPKPITDPGRANKVHALTERVMAEVIQPSMLTQAEMSRNPAGAVGRHMRQEMGKSHQRAILVWRRARLALDPKNDDPDFCNVEVFRREGGVSNGAATFMADAQLPGNFAMSPQAKANWPLAAPTTTAVAQVARREAQTKPLRKPMSLEARKAAGQRLANARAAKKMAATAAPGVQGNGPHPVMVPLPLEG